MDDAATRVLAFTIPGNPGDAAKNRARRAIVTRRKGKPVAQVIKSRRGRGFSALAIPIARSALARAGRPTIRACEVRITSYWARRRHMAGTVDLPLGDADAPIEAVLDVLTRAGVLEDDVLVRRVVATKVLDKDQPRIEVEIWTAAVAAREEQD